MFVTIIKRYLGRFSDIPDGLWFISKHDQIPVSEFIKYRGRYYTFCLEKIPDDHVFSFTVKNSKIIHGEINLQSKTI